MGFMDFIGDHTLGIGIGVVAIFIIYKFFVEPLAGKQELPKEFFPEEEEEYESL